MDGELNPTLLPLAERSNTKKCHKCIELTTEGFLEEADFDEDFLRPLLGGKEAEKINVQDNGV